MEIHAGRVFRFVEQSILKIPNGIVHYFTLPNHPVCVLITTHFCNVKALILHNWQFISLALHTLHEVQLLD